MKNSQKISWRSSESLVHENWKNNPEFKNHCKENKINKFANNLSWDLNALGNKMSPHLMANTISKISTKKPQKKPQSQKQNIYEKIFTWIQDTLCEFKHPANFFCGMISVKVSVSKGFTGLFQAPSELISVELVSSSFGYLKGRCLHVGQSDSPQRL